MPALTVFGSTGGRRPACAVTPGERAARAVMALVAAGVAFATWGRPWCAVPAAVCAGFLTIGAITGWCPTSLFARRDQYRDRARDRDRDRAQDRDRARDRVAAAHGYPDATAIVGVLVDSRSRRRS